VSIKGTELKWSGYDNGSEKLTYVLYLSKDRSAVANLLASHRIINNTNLTSYIADDLNAGGVYYWTVVPFNGFKHGKCNDSYFVFEINNPPTISVIPPQKASVGARFEYKLYGHDANDDDIKNLNYSFELAPEGMTINPSTGVITWTPAEAQVGNYTVTVWVSDGIDHANITFEIEISEKVKRSESSILFVITGVSFIVLLIAISSFIGGTEIGKYKFLSLFFVPLYNKLHPDNIFDNYARGQIHGYIKAKPGEHYSAIKKALELNNGTLAHHAKILEKEGYIYSERDGTHTRFYPKGMEKPEPDTIQRNLINLIESKPGITQHEIVTLLDSSQQVVSYNLTNLTRSNIIKLEHNGRENRYYINYETADSYQTQDQTESPVQSQSSIYSNNEASNYSNSNELDAKKY
jgi:predicted transcriptional regulator